MKKIEPPDLVVHKKWVFTLIKNYNFEPVDYGETYQDFAVYYYTYNYYKEGDCITNYIAVRFRNYLSHVAKRKQEPLLSYTEPDRLDFDLIDEDWEMSELEKYVLCSELLDGADSELRSWIEERAGSGWLWMPSIEEELAEERGFTRQGISKQMFKKLKRLRGNE